MTVDEVYQFFGSGTKAADAIGVSRSCFGRWVKNGRIPIAQQMKFEEISKGKLTAIKEEIRPSRKIFVVEEDSNTVVLPFFRYYDNKHGMFPVDSILFRKGKSPKITYAPFQRKNEKLSVFNTENLMQASSLVDCDGKTVYEGDILRLKHGKKVTFESIEMTETIKKLGKFKIIGNIFE
jgi:hypothetical protein